MVNIRKMTEFARSIISWYKSNKRELPWRETKDPYKIWISEVILQQTRIIQGLDYYHKFIEQFPNVVSLANAQEQDVMKVWQGLGYYSRARNLQYAAKQVMNQFGGKMPNSREGLLELKGIGPYTSAAIASISFGHSHAAIDGNAYRVLSRCFNIETPIDTGKGQKEFESLANELIQNAPPSDFNQAVMELGALVCAPTKPLCNECPLFSLCQARKENSIHLLPIKSKKSVRKKRHLNYLVIYDEEHVVLTKRIEKDIWQGLYEFPLIESQKKLSKKEILNEQSIQELNLEMEILQGNDIIHLLTHQELHVRFFYIQLPPTISMIKSFNNKEITKTNLYTTSSLPTHKVITDELNRILLSKNR